MYSDVSTCCQVICALDGVDQNAVNDNNETALDFAISRSAVGSVRTLLEYNVDASNACVDDASDGEIVQLLEEHLKRSVMKIIFFLFERILHFAFIFLYIQEIERITIRNRVLEEQRAKIQKYFKFQVVNQIYFVIFYKKSNRF